MLLAQEIARTNCGWGDGGIPYTLCRFPVKIHSVNVGISSQNSKPTFQLFEINSSFAKDFPESAKICSKIADLLTKLQILCQNCEFRDGIRDKVTPRGFFLSSLHLDIGIRMELTSDL